MFTYYTKETAPAESKPLIDQTIKMFGFFPNLSRVMAEAPITYEVFNRAYDLFTTKSGFSPVEQQVITMTANFENNCHYCTAAHSWVMKEYQKIPDDVIAALREGKPLADRRLEALRVFTHLLIEKRGHVGDTELQKFLDAGYTKRHALEVLAGLAEKLITNFTNALAHTELDDQVKPFAWVHPNQRGQAV